MKNDEQEALKLVEADASALDLAWVRQFPRACLRAVEKNGYNLKYVLNQTSEICLAAVSEEGDALKYVKDKTPEICIAAVENYSYAIEYIDNPTTEVCLAAIKRNPGIIRLVKVTTQLAAALASHPGMPIFLYGIDFEVPMEALELCVNAGFNVTVLPSSDCGRV